MASDYESSSLARTHEEDGLQRILTGSQMFSELNPDSIDLDMGNEILYQMGATSSSHDGMLLSRSSRTMKMRQFLQLEKLLHPLKDVELSIVWYSTTQEPKIYIGI